MVVYKTTNILNGKIYVGKDKYNNSDYLGSGIIIKQAIEKNGKKNFTKEIIEYCTSMEILNERETYWIKKLKSQDRKIGYNISLGGDGNSGSWNGEHLTEDHKNNISKGLKNSVKFQDMWCEDGNHRDKLSEARKSSERVQELYDSEEWRKKVSNGLKNSDIYYEVVKSEERRKNVSIGIRNSNKFQKKVCKEVIQFDLKRNIIKEFSSISEASNKTNTSRTTISNACHYNKQKGNFNWEFKNGKKK